MKEVVFCECEYDVDHALAQPGDGERIVMPLTPSAAARLAQAGIVYKRMEDFYSESELCCGAAARTERLVLWADVLDAFLAERVPEFREPRFTPNRLYLFFLGWLSNALYFRAHALDRLARAVQPARVAWSEPPPAAARIAPDLGYWTSSVSLWPPVISAWARARGVETQRFVSSPETRPASQTDPGGRASLRSHRQLLRREGLAGYSRYITSRVGSILARTLSSRSSLEGVILFLQDNYDLGATRRALGRLGHTCVSWEQLSLPPFPAATTRDLAGRLARLWGEAERTANLFGPFVADGLDLSDVAAHRLRSFWVDVIPEMYGHFVRARAFFSATRPNALLAPYAEAPWQSPTLEAARSLGVPTIIYEHGGFQGACELPIWRETDRHVADYLFVYGDGVRAYLDEDDLRLGAPRARTVVVGSARLDALRRRPSPGAVASIRRASGLRSGSTPLVLYVPYMLRGNLRYLSCDDYPDVWFYDLQARIIDLFREFPDVHLVYKTFSDALANPLRARAHAMPNVSVIEPFEMRVTRLMWGADAILLDIPSTALLECLLTPKPIIVFADKQCLRMREEAKGLLRRRASLAETPDDFVAAARRLLEDRRFAELVRPDDGFLRAYGSHLGDGHSAERAATAVLGIIEAHGHP